LFGHYKPEIVSPISIYQAAVTKAGRDLAFFRVSSNLSIQTGGTFGWYNCAVQILEALEY
jgi:hypothetical protein